MAPLPLLLSLLLLLAAAPPAAQAAGPDLECKIHVLAVEFAKELQPERDLSTVLSGLQVTSSDPTSLSGLNCTFGPVPPPPPPAPPPPPPSPPPAWPAKGHCSLPHPGWSLAQESGAHVAAKTDTVAECEALCKGNCTGYTWHDKTTGSFFKSCYLTTGLWSGGVADTAGHISGICNNGQPAPPNVPPPTPAKGTCSAIIDGWSMTTAPGGQSGSDGKTPTAMGCEAKCKAAPKCTAFTWHDNTTGSFATECYVIESGAKWSQGSAESGHHTALCTPATGSTDAIAQQQEPALQSYGGIMRPSSLWPVPGQGNDNYPRGGLRPADGKSRSQGLTGKRQGVPEIPAAASTLYVDYGHGSDSRPGSKAAPLKTIAAAVAKAQSLPAPRTILLTGTSTHYLSETVRITAEHSELTITSAPEQQGQQGQQAAEAVVSGGVEFTPKWTKGGKTHDGTATIFTTAVPKGLSFLELFNSSTSARYVPAREPNGNVELDQNNYHSSAASWLPAVDFGTATLVTNGSYIDASGKNISINRGGMFDQYAIGIGGPANNFKPSASYWAQVTNSLLFDFLMKNDDGITAGSGQTQRELKMGYVTQAHPRGGGASTYTIPSGMVVGKLSAEAAAAAAAADAEQHGAADDGACKMQANTDYAGHDLQPVQGRAAANPQACCDLCSKVAGCHFWTWQSATACYLKDSMAGAHAYPGATSGSGPPGPPAPPPPPPPAPPPTLQAGGKDGFVFMMHTHAWGSWVYEIESTTVSATGTTVKFGKGGQQEARGTGSPTTGGGTFYLSHRKEFLDTALEWYLDKEKGELTLAVPTGEVPPATLIAPVTKQLFSLEGSQTAPVSRVRLSALTFKHAAPTYMDDYAVGSGGDYSLYQGGVVHMNGTTNSTIDHCLFDAVGGNGIFLTDFNRHALISANEMRHIGENGVAMRGSTDWVDGRGGNQPRFNEISGNMIHHLGLYTKQSCAIFSAVSCQNTISENIMFHGPRALVNMNDGFGGDTLIERNLFFASLLETSDHGPYNSWDRLPFLTDVKFNNGTGSISLAYNKLVSNFFFTGSPYSIDTDDGSDMVNATANVIYKQPLFKTDFGGHTKAYSKNVEIYGGGCGCVAGDPTNQFVDNQCVGELSPCKCSTSNTSFDVIAGNHYYSPTVNTSAPVCPAGSKIEADSENAPMPTTEAVLGLARAALGMPPAM